MRDVIVGIDAGTSVIKSVAFDLTGRQIAAASRPNSALTIDGQAAVQDMNQTWADTARTLQELAQELPDLANRIAVLSITAQGDGTWLIDEAGEPTGPAWTWLDARAATLAGARARQPSDQERFEITATGLAACQQGPQLAWMQQHTPEILNRSSHAMHCKDWLYFKLTRERATDPSEGTFTFGDFRTRTYHDDVIGFFDLNARKHLIPPMVDGVKHIAKLSDTAAAATGLLAGTPVILGYVDVVCTALGAGFYEKSVDLGCTIVGSTGVHMRLVSSPDQVTLNPERTGYVMQMPVPGACAQLQTNMASTLNIDWLLDVGLSLLRSQGIDRSRSDLLPMIDGWLDRAKPGAILYQPYVSEAGERGPFVDGRARAGFVGLSTQHEFGDMMRAVVEGLALAGRDCYEAMGPLPKEIRLTGGAARSKALRRIFGAALRADIRTSFREEAGAAGAAMMAAVAIGQYPSMDDCCHDWVTPLLGGKEPADPELAAVYDRTLESYIAARTALRPIWHAMAENRGVGP